jgi:hypothetical protein
LTRRYDRLRAVALLVAVLGAGFALGWFSHDNARHSRRRGEPREEAMVRKLERELTLTGPQRDSVRAIVMRHHADIRGLWQEMHPRYDSLRAVTRAEIDAQLTPEQRALHERLIEKQKHRDRESDRRGKEAHGKL